MSVGQWKEINFQKLIEKYFISNPYDTTNCMALYGGPIEPRIALGGYPEPEEGMA